MNPIALLMAGVLMLAMESGIAQDAKTKPIGEEQAQEIAMAKVGAGRVEFMERKSDGAKTFYEIYIMRGDTLVKASIDGYRSAIDSINIDAKAGRQRLQARQLAYKRAKSVAEKEATGETLRWKIRKVDNVWCYRFFIETTDKRSKEVYVDGNTFKVVRVRSLINVEQAAID